MQSPGLLRLTCLVRSSLEWSLKISVLAKYTHGSGSEPNTEATEREWIEALSELWQE